MDKKKTFKMGIFGASFNPLHLGHLSLLTEAQKIFKFDLIQVVPAYQSPFVLPIREILPQQRLALVQEALKNYSFVEIDDQEIKKEGLSYTIDTMNRIQKEKPFVTEVFLIIGMDQWAQFDQWKKYKAIIEKAHLVIYGRKGYDEKSSTPFALQKFLQSPVSFPSLRPETNSKSDISSEWFYHWSSYPALKGKTKMITGKNIYWLSLKNRDISSSQIRRRRREGLFISHLVPPVVDQWIRKWNLYQEPVAAVEISALAQFCVDTLLDKKAQKAKIFDLRSFSSIPFEFSLVVSGFNTRHTKVMADYLQKQVKKEFSLCAQCVEGREVGEWVVLDYGELVVHIFYDYTREYYRLEELWNKASRV